MRGPRHRGSYDSKPHPDPFCSVELEAQACLEENRLQVLCVFNVYGRTRRVWIPRGAITDIVGGKMIVVGEKVKKGMTYFKIKIPKRYAIARGLWDPDDR